MTQMPSVAVSVPISEVPLLRVVAGFLLKDQIVARRFDGAPFIQTVTLHRVSPSPDMGTMPKQIDHKNNKEQTTKEYVHKSTIKQSDTKK